MTLHSARYWRIVGKYQEAEKKMNETQTPEEWFAQQDGEMQLASERQAVEALLPYWENQQAESRFKAEKEACGRIIKAFMETHDTDELVDIERGLRAQLKGRTDHEERYDVRHMTQKQVIALWKAGCLVVDSKALNHEANAYLRMDVQAQRMPARGLAPALRVIKE